MKRHGFFYYFCGIFQSRTTMKHVACIIFFSLMATVAFSQSYTGSIVDRLKGIPVQEKVYLHLDNNCYFKGDTIWYKAYVVRADNNQYTDMSRILYVELVSPDGMLVERQHIIVSSKGFCCGNFELKDSLYSGFYELRAYTRWMMNFDVTEHPYWKKDRIMFYSSGMAQDFFRQYGTIHSRVVPVYERPEQKGDYSQRYFQSRPKEIIQKEEKDRLQVAFFPEGGHLIEGTRCRVAFEATNKKGEQVKVEGTIGDQQIATTHHGRGVFEVQVPEKGKLQAKFSYLDKYVTFDLPAAEPVGCSLTIETSGGSMRAKMVSKGLPTDHSYLAVILQGGICQKSWPLKWDVNGTASVEWEKKDLPSGVNDLVILDDQGIPISDRLFFVNNHEYDMSSVSVEGIEDEYAPYSMVSLDFHAPADAGHISIAVRDQSAESPSFDDGNIMTDLLLSSELKGFIPYPSYYFESDDEEHTQALDLLMMVQGWRRYNIKNLLDNHPMRYEPEKDITVEGRVYKTIYLNDRDYKADEQWGEEFFNSGGIANISQNSGEGNTSEREEVVFVEDFPDGMSTVDQQYYMNYGNLKHEVVLEGELILGTDVYSVSMDTEDGGKYSFHVPPFYGKGILTLAAHKKNDTEKDIKKKMAKGRLDEDQYPDFYVKRDLFFPVFAKKYSFYQNHVPWVESYIDNEISETPDTTHLSSMDKTLASVEVKGKRRRGRRSIDYTRPLCSYDAVELYNLATDYGLSYGKFVPDLFPYQVSMLLLGNLNTNRDISIKKSINYYLTYLEAIYKDSSEVAKDQLEIMKIGGYDTFRGFNEIKLKRLKSINVFSDFELRNEDTPMVHAQDNSISSAYDVTIDYRSLLNDAERPTFRDRWMIFPGIYEPDDFYHPDYSHAPPTDGVRDYRRTLYWNPNAQLDENGNYQARFYNNGKNTKITVSTAGVTKDGIPVTNLSPKTVKGR